MRSYEVRGRTGRAVRRKKSKRREEDEEERGGWAADMTCYRFREKKRQKVGQDPEEKTKFQDCKKTLSLGTNVCCRSSTT